MEYILSSAPVSWEGAWRPDRDRLGWRRLGSSLANPRSMKCGQTSSPHPKHGVPWTGMTLPGNLSPARGAGEPGRASGSWTLLVSGIGAKVSLFLSWGLCHGQWKGREQRRAQLDF